MSDVIGAMGKCHRNFADFALPEGAFIKFHFSSHDHLAADR